ncbi:MAG: CinA family nicotinamide mononucleotide deamidase-related protein [Planctomycetota bacterium]
MSAPAAPTAFVISIGEELLEGRIVDTNAGTFAQEFLRRGFHVVGKATIGDAPGELTSLLQRLRGTVDVVLSTGGLGPTEDDRVREEVAAALACDLAPVPVEGAEAYLREVYRRFRDTEPPSFFLAQATMPECAEPLANAVGTAWGFMSDLGVGTRLYNLPGPPRECASAFFDGGAAADLEQRFQTEASPLEHAVIRTVGAPESLIEEPIRNLLRPGQNPRIGITAGADGVSLSLLARPGEDGRPAKEILEECVCTLEERLFPFVWGRDEQTLAEVVVQGLHQAGQSVACAESCTGGMLAGALTDVAGSSAAFTHGWVTYANEAKVAQLGVPEGVLEAVGAVSKEVALAMAEGARRHSGSDWGIGITGIAGPGGGTEEKPVGTVYLALVGPGCSEVRHLKQYARGGRSFVRRQTVRDALNLLRLQLAETSS